jgi:hypothetical protein
MHVYYTSVATCSLHATGQNATKGAVDSLLWLYGSAQHRFIGRKP